MAYKNRNCLMCRKEYSPNGSNQKYCSKCSKDKEKQKEDIKGYNKRYYQKNKNDTEYKLKKKECREKWDKKNPNYSKGYKKEWREENPNYSKEHYEEHKDRIKENYNKIKDNPKFKLKNKTKSRKHYEEHKENYEFKLEMKARCKKWREENPNYNIEYHQKIIKEENKRRKKLGLALVGEGYTSEMELLVYVHSLFGNYDILTHHRKPLIDWKPKGLELDIYIPELKLAFEYMGEQHYNFHKFFHNGNEEEFVTQQYRDRCKKRICKLKGIALIKIKYDEKLSESLILSKLKFINIKTNQMDLLQVPQIN